MKYTSTEYARNHYSRITVHEGPAQTRFGKFSTLDTSFQEGLHTQGGRRMLAIYIKRLQERLDDAEWRFGG